MSEAHRRSCVCARCKADRDARYAALQAEARQAPPATKRREPYAETRARSRPAPRRGPNLAAAPHAAALARRLPPMTRKENAKCCMAQRDGQGRLPVGYCGPDCLRRVERDLRLAIPR